MKNNTKNNHAQTITAVRDFIVVIMLVIFLLVVSYPRVVAYLASVPTGDGARAIPTAAPLMAVTTVKEVITFEEAPARIIELSTVAPQAVIATPAPVVATVSFTEQHPVVEASDEHCQTAKASGRRSNPNCASTPIRQGR